MKEIIQLFNQALSLLKEISDKVKSQKDKYWDDTLKEIEKNADIIDGVPYIRTEDFNITIDETETFNPISNQELINLQAEDEVVEDFPIITNDEIEEAVALPCDSEETEDFAPITKDEECVCDDPTVIDNSYSLQQFVEPVLTETVGEFPDNDCVRRAQEWAKKLTDLALEYSSLKTWEGDNYKRIEYWKLFWLYFDNRESVLPEFKNFNFKLIRQIIKSVKVDKISLNRSFKRFSNELSISLTEKEIWLNWNDKNKTEGSLFDWSTAFEEGLKNIKDDDPDRATKIPLLEKSLKTLFIEDPKEKLVDDLKLWTKKHIAELLLVNKLHTITSRWKKEYDELSQKEEWVNIKNNINRLSEIEDLLIKTQEDMKADLLNAGCSVPDVESILPDEEPDYRGNPKIGSPNSLEMKWWKKFSTLATLVNLVPIHWPVGILVPNPSGLLKIPMPIVWIPLIVIPIPTGVMVFFIGQCGICPSPVMFVWNTHPSKSLGPVNADSMSFPVAIRPSSNWKKGGGSKIIDAIPWVSNLFSKVDPQPELTKKFPYIKDDMPSWERLTLKNPLLLLHLWDWASNGKKSCGFFENP